MSEAPTRGGGGGEAANKLRRLGKASSRSVVEEMAAVEEIAASEQVAHPPVQAPAASVQPEPAVMRSRVVSAPAAAPAAEPAPTSSGRLTGFGASCGRDRDRADEGQGLEDRGPAPDPRGIRSDSRGLPGHLLLGRLPEPERFSAQRAHRLLRGVGSEVQPRGAFQGRRSGPSRPTAGLLAGACEGPSGQGSGRGLRFVHKPAPSPGSSCRFLTRYAAGAGVGRARRRTEPFQLSEVESGPGSPAPSPKAGEASRTRGCHPSFQTFCPPTGVLGRGLTSSPNRWPESLRATRTRPTQEDPLCRTAAHSRSASGSLPAAPGPPGTRPVNRARCSMPLSHCSPEACGAAETGRPDRYADTGTSFPTPKHAARIFRPQRTVRERGPGPFPGRRPFTPRGRSAGCG